MTSLTCESSSSVSVWQVCASWEGDLSRNQRKLFEMVNISTEMSTDLVGDQITFAGHPGFWFPHWAGAEMESRKRGTCYWGWSRQLSNQPWSLHHTPNSHRCYSVNNWTYVPRKPIKVSLNATGIHKIYVSFKVSQTHFNGVILRGLSEAGIRTHVWGLQSFRYCQWWT